MATAANVTEEENILKCGICFDVLTDPKVLECRHAFCADCIISHFKNAKQNCAPCPICRRKYWPPKRNPERLSNCSIPLCQLLEVRKKGNHSCESESCDNDSAPFTCVKCRKWLCHTCREFQCPNDPISMTKHDAHREFDVDPYLFDIVVQSRFRLCREHRQYEVSLFCPKCEKLVCQLCRKNQHLHHELTNITEYAEKIRADLSKCSKLLKMKEEENLNAGQIFQNLLLSFNSKMKDEVTSNWQTLLDRSQADSKECDILRHLITHLLLYGSCEVIIDSYPIVKKRIDFVLNRCFCHELDEERNFVDKFTDVLSSNQEKSTMGVSNTRYTNKVCKCAGLDFGTCKVKEGYAEQKIDGHTQDNISENDILKKKISDIMQEIAKNGKNHELACKHGFNLHADFWHSDKSNDKWKSHPENLTCLHCNTCKMLICNNCQTDKHKIHEVSSIEIKKTVCCK